MKFENIKTLLIVFLIGLFWFKSCNSETKTETKYIKVKSVSGKATFEKPKQTVVTDQNKKQIPELKSKSDNEFLQNEIDRLLSENKILIDELSTKSEAEIKEIYSEAIDVNYFERKIDNDTVKIDVYGLTRGTIETMQIDWKVKERKQEIEQKELLFRLLLGGEIGLNKELNQGTYKINLGLQNKKNDILRFSYQKIGDVEYGLIGFDKSIFSINKKVKK